VFPLKNETAFVGSVKTMKVMVVMLLATRPKFKFIEHFLSVLRV